MDFLCPHTKTIPLQCDGVYEMRQFYKYLEHLQKSGEISYILLDETQKCLCDPKLCPRYVQHMAANNKSR